MPNIQSLPHTRTRRKTACAMLFVWLFALASGLANACMLQPHGIRDYQATLSQPSATGSMLGSAEHEAERPTGGNGDSNTGLAKQSCLKVCDEGSQTLLKHASSVDLVDPGLAPFVVAAWPAEAHISHGSALARAHDFLLPKRGPPTRFLFSRLSL